MRRLASWKLDSKKGSCPRGFGLEDGPEEADLAKAGLEETGFEEAGLDEAGLEEAGLEEVGIEEAALKIIRRGLRQTLE